MFELARLTAERKMPGEKESEKEHEKRKGRQEKEERDRGARCTLLVTEVNQSDDPTHKKALVEKVMLHFFFFRSFSSAKCPFLSLSFKLRKACRHSSCIFSSRPLCQVVGKQKKEFYTRVSPSAGDPSLSLPLDRPLSRRMRRGARQPDIKESDIWPPKEGRHVLLWNATPHQPFHMKSSLRTRTSRSGYRAIEENSLRGDEAEPDLSLWRCANGSRTDAFLHRRREGASSLLLSLRGHRSCRS